MKDYRKTIGTLLLLIIFVVLIGAFFKLMHWPWGNQLLIIGLISVSILFLITLYDMAISNIKHRGFWIMALILNPFVVGFLYCFVKDDIEIKD